MFAFRVRSISSLRFFKFRFARSKPIRVIEPRRAKPLRPLIVGGGGSSDNSRCHCCFRLWQARRKRQQWPPSQKCCLPGAGDDDDDAARARARAPTCGIRPLCWPRLFVLCCSVAGADTIRADPPPPPSFHALCCGRLANWLELARQREGGGKETSNERRVFAARRPFIWRRATETSRASKSGGRANVSVATAAAASSENERARVEKSASSPSRVRCDASRLPPPPPPPLNSLRHAELRLDMGAATVVACECAQQIKV